MLDKRYKILKTLLDGGNVTSFEYMLEIVPLSTLRQDLKTNYSSLKKKMQHPGLFSITEIYAIAHLIDCDGDILLQMAKNEFLKTRKKTK